MRLDKKIESSVFKTVGKLSKDNYDDNNKAIRDCIGLHGLLSNEPKVNVSLTVSLLSILLLKTKASKNSTKNLQSSL